MESEDDINILLNLKLVDLLFFKTFTLPPIIIDNFIEKAFSYQSYRKQDFLQFIDVLVGGEFFHKFAVVMFGFMAGFDCTLLPLLLLSLAKDVEEKKAVELFSKGDGFSYGVGRESFSEVEVENVNFFEIK